MNMENLTKTEQQLYLVRVEPAAPGQQPSMVAFETAFEVATFIDTVRPRPVVITTIDFGVCDA